MKQKIGLWQLMGFAVTSLGGTLLHFLYDWTNFLPLSLISSVNESTWEHMKLMVSPMLLFALVQSFYFKNYSKNFWKIKLIGLLVGTASIPILFYTLTGIFGTLSGTTNIIIFFVSIILAFSLETRLFKKDCKFSKFEMLYVIILCLTWILFAIFTIYPPKLPLFLDPITKTYGITL